MSRACDHTHILTQLEKDFLVDIERCSRISKANSQTLQDGLAKLVDFCHSVIGENVKLREQAKLGDFMKGTTTQLASMQKAIDDIRNKQVCDTGSYADKARAPKTNKTVNRARPKIDRLSVEMPRKRFACIISPKEVAASSGPMDIKKQVLEKLAISSKNIKINNVKVLPVKKSVVIEAADELSLKKILTDVGVATSNNVRKLGRHNPKIIVKHVPKGACAKDLISVIKAQNQDRFEGLPIESSLIPRFKIGPKDRDNEHWVCEVVPKLHAALKQRDNGCFYYEQYRLKVDTYISINQCYKCLRFGHMAKYCKEKEGNCGHCGGTEHKSDTCTAKAKPSCVNCVRRGRRDTCHTAWDKNCPAILEQQRLVNSKTDYGY